MILIGFGHEKCVGKDTAAKFLSTFLKMNFKGLHIKSFGFASKLKDVCHQLYSWAGLKDEEYYERPDCRHEKEIVLPVLGKSPRRIWIDFGTHAVREQVYEDTWVDYVQHNVKCDIGLIKDLRFPNEADRVLFHGGFVFKVDNPRVEHSSDEADDPLLNYTRWTAHLLNDSTFHVFNQRVEALARQFILPRLVNIQGDSNEKKC